MAAVCTKTWFAGPGEPLPEDAVAEIAAGLRDEGKVLVFPTDTVYGIGCSAFRPGSAARIYEIKGRDPAKALPILVHSLDEARRWVRLDGAAAELARRHWPGALTLVLPPTPEGARLAPAGSASLALRVPDHPVLLRLLEASEVPWATTSANRSGEPAIAGGEAAAAAFGGLADYVVAAGPAGGTESTIVDATGPDLRVLRQGALDIRP